MDSPLCRNFEDNGLRRYSLYGVVSSGLRCAQEYPDIYTLVAHKEVRDDIRTLFMENKIE